MRALHKLGRATVSEIAGAVGVKSVTVRHHLTSLQADGLISADEERRTVGRPVYIFRLTPKAEQLFPQSFHILVDGLLKQLKQNLEPEMVDMLINAMAGALAGDLRQELDGLPDDKARRASMIQWLDDKGLTAIWQESSDGLQLVKYRCPYYAVGDHHPELCQIDEELVRIALDAEVMRSACLLEGDSNCTLVLSDLPNTLTGSDI